MAKLVFGMNQSLDGYVDHMAFAPSPTLFRHFVAEAEGQAPPRPLRPGACRWCGPPLVPRRARRGSRAPGRSSGP